MLTKIQFYYFHYILFFEDQPNESYPGNELTVSSLNALTLSSQTGEADIGPENNNSNTSSNPLASSCVSGSLPTVAVSSNSTTTNNSTLNLAQSTNSLTASLTSSASTTTTVLTNSNTNSLPAGLAPQHHVIQPPQPQQPVLNPNIFTFDPWTECLALFFSYDYLFTKCPQVRLEAWPFVYMRLQQLMHSVDPNEHPSHEATSRTSLLFGVGANSLEKMRRAASERDAALNIWKNFLVGACSLAPGSDRLMYMRDYERAMTRTDEWAELAAPQPQPLITATHLLRLIVPYLKCDCNYFRECCIRALGKMSVESVKDLVDELAPSIKECLADLKQQRADKVRRMKKKDVTRLAIVRILELCAEQCTLGKRLIDEAVATKKDHPTLFEKTFSDYIDGMCVYLEQTTTTTTVSQSSQTGLNEPDLVVQARIHFCLFLHKLVDSVNRDRRHLLFKESTKYTLFFMCDKWSGRFSLSQHLNNSTSPSSTMVFFLPKFCNLKKNSRYYNCVWPVTI
jgi:hypothetical protein